MNTPVRLNRNENAWGCSPRVLDALRQLDVNDVSRYPDGDPLRDALARQFGLGSAQVLVTAAGDEAIRCVVDGLTEPGDRIVIPDPEFPIFRWCAETRQRVVTAVPLDRDFRYDSDAVIRAGADATLVVLISPHNPTGSTLPAADLEQILQALPDTTVLLDEAYGEFNGNTVAGRVNQYPNLLVLKTFSKAFGLAGMRLGMLAGSADRIRQAAQAQMPYSVGTPTLKAGLVALNDTEFVRRVRERLVLNRYRMRDGLGRCGIMTLPSRSNFLCAWFGKGAVDIQASLKSDGLVIRDITGAHGMPGWLRFTVGNGRETRFAVETAARRFRPQALLFDMDGVLVDVRESYRKTIARTVESFTGVEPSPQEIQRLKNEGGYNCDWSLTERLIRDAGMKADRQAVVDRFQRLFLGENGNGLIRNERIVVNPEMLRRLKETYRLGVVTGRPATETRLTLNRLNLTDMFDVVVTRDDIAPESGKPEPDGLLQAMEKLGVTGGVYLGDTVDDIRAALRARLVPLGVTAPGAGRNTRRRLLEAGAVRVLNSVNKLEDWIHAKRNN